LAHWDQILGEGVYPVPYAVETRLCLVDLEDVAQVAARVLTEPGHMGATYELVGTEALSQVEVAEVLGQKLGRPISAQVVPIEVWERRVRELGMGEYQIETLIKMFHYYERHSFSGSPRVLGWLLQRPPTTWDEFVAREQLRYNP
jgi:nucleoside-diphosphate-sugar epimerase